MWIWLSTAKAPGWLLFLREASAIKCFQETIMNWHHMCMSKYRLKCVNPLCWISLEADRAVRSTLRVQLCLVSTVHRLKIEVCSNPHLLPHAHSLFLPLSLRPKAEPKSALNRPGVSAHPIAHEKRIGSFRALRGKPRTLRSSLSRCTLTRGNNESPISSHNASSGEGAENHSSRH